MKNWINNAWRIRTCTVRIAGNLILVNELKQIPFTTFSLACNLTDHKIRNRLPDSWSSMTWILRYAAFEQQHEISFLSNYRSSELLLSLVSWPFFFAVVLGFLFIGSLVFMLIEGSQKCFVLGYKNVWDAILLFINI